MEDVRGPRDALKEWVEDRGCSLTWVAEKNRVSAVFVALYQG
jgi:hypothetical protein